MVGSVRARTNDIPGFKYLLVNSPHTGKGLSDGDILLCK